MGKIIIFIMDLNKYRNFINNLIIWEWNILKQLRRERRRNFLLRGSFLFLCLGSILFCVFFPPFIVGTLLKAIGAPNTLVDWTNIISFFLWLWFISPIDKLSKKERKEKNRRKVEVIKAIEKAREGLDDRFK
tara:strand:+ start:11 stop:406 length:396 start_codon:yes stop_codon:yes gene_type:complete